MVMYKQNQGLMAKGTVGTQSTGGTTMPKKPQSYNLQSINFGGMSASGRPSVGSQIWGALNPMNWNLGPSAGTQPTPKPPSIEQQAPQPTTSAQRTELSQPEIMDLINNGYIYTARGMSNEGLRIAYDKMMSDRRAAQGRMSNQETQAAQTVQAQPVITPDFRISTTSPYANLVNPYGTDYRTGMMSRVSAQTARQFAPQREQLESRLSGSGITADSPLYQSLMAQQEGLESGARLQAVSAAEEAGIQAAANWDMQRAQGEAGWQQNLQFTAERLAKQPAEIGSLEARRDADVVAAAVAQLDLETKTKLIEQARAALEADFRRRGYDAETARSESIAAAQSLERNDPNQWYNAWWWPIAGKAIGAALGGTAGFFIGGPPGALYGAGIGAGLMPSGIPFPQSGGAMSRPPAPGGSFQITPGGIVA